jgi:hypothetical protein
MMTMMSAGSAEAPAPCGPRRDHAGVEGLKRKAGRGSPGVEADADQDEALDAEEVRQASEDHRPHGEEHDERGHTQLTPDGVSPYWWEIAGVETLNTVSLRTAKKTR